MKDFSVPLPVAISSTVLILLAIVWSFSTQQTLRKEVLAKDVLVVGMVLELNNASAALKKAQADAEAMTKDRDEWKALALEAKLLMQDTSKRINEMMQLSDKLLRLVEGGQAKQAVRQQE